MNRILKISLDMNISKTEKIIEISKIVDEKNFSIENEIRNNIKLCNDNKKRIIRILLRLKSYNKKYKSLYTDFRLYYTMKYVNDTRTYFNTGYINFFKKDNEYLPKKLNANIDFIFTLIILLIIYISIYK